MSDRNPNTHHILADVSAELALLASAARGGAEIVAGLVGWVGDDWFFRREHAAAWGVIASVIAQGQSVDQVTLKSGLLKTGIEPRDAEELWEKISGAHSVPSARQWRKYAEVLEAWRIRRKGVQAADEMRATFYDLTVEAVEARAAAEAAIFGLHSRRAREGARHRSEFVDRIIAEFMEAFSGRGHVIGGLGTGFTDIDRLYIKGLRTGHMILIGAPPGGGKTLLLSKILDNLSRGVGDYAEFKQTGVPVLLVSLEMDGHELTERDFVRVTRISLNAAQRGQVSREVKDGVSAAMRPLQEAPFYILHMPGASIQQVVAQVKFEVARLGIKVIGLDYVQCLRSDSKRAREGRTQEMQEISSELDKLAADLQVPLIAAAQLKTDAYTGRPKLEHLRETAQLGQDADLVMLLSPWGQIVKSEQRKQQASKDMKEAFGDDDEDDGPPDGLDEYMACDVVKNRHGGRTSHKPEPIKLKWDGAYYDLMSTCHKLFDSTGKETQR
jgi:replicative DNA helicase